MEYKKEQKFTKIMKNIGNSEIVSKISGGIFSLGFGFIPYAVLSNPNLIHKISASSSIEDVLQNTLPWVGTVFSGVYIGNSFSKKDRKPSLRNTYKISKVNNEPSVKKGVTKIGQLIAGAYLLGSLFNVAEDGIDAYFKAKNLFPKENIKTEHIQKNKEPLEEIIKKDTNSFLDQKVEKNIDSLLSNHLKPYVEDQISKLSAYESKGWLNPDNYLAKAVMMSESGADPNAKSKAGAKGPFQTMAWLDNGKDPKRNIDKGADHLFNLKNKYKDEYLALAAYNWGEGNLNKAIKKYGRELEKLYSHLPLETRNYIIRIKSREMILENLSKYNIKPEKKYILYQIKEGDTFWGISREYNTETDSIIKANKHYKKDPTKILPDDWILVPDKRENKKSVSYVASDN